MKKLVYLLILSLCANGLAGASLPWLQSARAASKTEEKSEKSDKKSKKEKSEKKTSNDQSDKNGKDSEKSDKKQKKTKVEKEKEYTLDLAQNNQVALSVVLKLTKMDIKLKDVKSIELEDEKDKKRILWEEDEDNEGDYILTVLKDFKSLKLRIVTKKTSRLLVLKNGAKGEAKDGEAAKPVEAAEAEATKAPSEKKKKKDDSETTEGPAEEKTEEPSRKKAPQEAADSELDMLGIPMQEPTEVDEDIITGEDEQFVESVVSVTETAMDAAESQDDTTEEHGVSDTDQPGESTEEQPGESTEAQPGGSTEEQPGESTEEEPGESTEEQPGESTEEQPGDSTAAQPGESTEAQPGEDTEEEPGESTEEEPDQSSEEEQTEPTGESDESGDAQGEPGGEDGDEARDAEQTETPADGSGEAPQPEAGASIPEEAEAWFKRETELLWGSLEAIIAQLTGGETVYIQTDKLMLIKEAPTQLMSTVTLLPDGDAFKGSYSVCVSTDNPALVAEPAMLQPADLPALGDVADLYIWVKPDEQTPPEEEEPGEEGEKPTLVVATKGFEPTGWSRTQPQFTLSGIPEGKEWSYAAIIYDERFVPIASNVYAPDQEGIFTLRFAMLNELGDIMAASEQYTLQLDWTAPEVSIEVDEETSYTLNIYATDKASGLDAVSVDKGKTWEPIDEDGYTVTEEAEKTFKAGAIRIRDVAGNVYKSEEEYTVSEVEGEGEEGEEGEEDGEYEGGGGGGGGDGGSGTPALPHSRGDGEEGVDYDALILDLPDGPMEQLTVGGEPMDLNLVLTNAQEPGAPVGANQPFTGRLCHWKDASNDDSPNTLLLEAEIADDLGDAFTYEWHFNGEVYRMLANSGIKYVALKVDDTVAAFPTEGFTGGTRYTELKMQGVSTRKFDYTLAMKMNLDPSHVSAMTDSDYSQECDLSILAKVEDTNYELSNSPQSMMYFYNVFLGPEDMMNQPFGEYRA